MTNIFPIFSYSKAVLPNCWPSSRNLTLLMCTLLKSTVFWKLVRQSSLRQSSWVERPPPLPLALFHLSYIPQVSYLAQKLYISRSAQCVLFEISLTPCWFDFYEKETFPVQSFGILFFVLLQGRRSTKKHNSLLQYINIVQMYWSWIIQSIFVMCCACVLVWYICGFSVCIYEGVFYMSELVVICVWQENKDFLFSHSSSNWNWYWKILHWSKRGGENLKTSKHA